MNYIRACGDKNNKIKSTVQWYIAAQSASLSTNSIHQTNIWLRNIIQINFTFTEPFKTKLQSALCG